MKERDVKEKEKEEIKLAKVSFLKAFFERKGNCSTDPKLITPKRRRKRKVERSIELQNQRKIDTYLIGKENVQGEKPTPVKRKIKEIENSNLGTPCTPEKLRRLGVNKKSAVYSEPVWDFNLE